MFSIVNSDDRFDDSAEQIDEFEDPKDLRIEMKVKNNALWHAIHEHHPSVLAFCRKHKKKLGEASYVRIYKLLGFKSHPFKKVGNPKTGYYYGSEYREICLMLEKILRVPTEALFPRNLYDRLVGGVTAKIVEVSSFTALPYEVRQQVRALPAPAEDRPEVKVDEILLREKISRVLKTLSYREREIIKFRFGLSDGYNYTLEEVAAHFKITQERVRQIEAKAVRKLQQPSRSQMLTGFLG